MDGFAALADPTRRRIIDLLIAGERSAGDIAAEAGLSRIHIFAWRDLADVEAGGSELHAAEVARHWAAAGIDVTMRTSWAQGSPQMATRDGYRVVRKAGRYMVFPRAGAARVELPVRRDE